jgi:hypothetical protein
MCKPGFDKLSLSGLWLVFTRFFPLALSPSKGERLFIDTPYQGGGEGEVAHAPLRNLP